MQHQETNYTRLFLAIFLAALVLITWQTKVEWPRRQALAKLSAQVTTKRHEEQVRHVDAVPVKETNDADENPDLTRDQRLAAVSRVKIATDDLAGSISLKGARFDNLVLSKYLTSLNAQSPGLTLLAPNGDAEGYFVQTGWVSGDNKTKVPDQHTLWTADKKQLTTTSPVTLMWKNDDNVTFELHVSLDENYMFTIDQKVLNNSGHEITVVPYAYINRTEDVNAVPVAGTPAKKPAGFLHEGPIGVMDNTLNEVNYKELKEKGNKTFDNTSGWFGITDKYWLTALIPSEPKQKVTLSYYAKSNRDRFQVDYLSEARAIASGATDSTNVRLFAGAKELHLLDYYTKGHDSAPPVPLFDRALDFGSFYFLAKPMCLVVNYLFHATGNFGVAILIFIIFVKALMFPLANKSFKSMAQMRKLQPEMVKIRERHVDDQIGLHKATRELYKREKVNPAAGCLPVLIQLVVFLALFRGLNVMIELRHAPFYGWLKDLSAPDPSNLFTGFGLIPWNNPSWLHLALLPMLYCLTMIIQTSLQPKPADPIQAKMMTWMPYMMLIFFDTMASGFVLYWTWSNVLSILQQRFITKRHNMTNIEPPLARELGL